MIEHELKNDEPHPMSLKAHGYVLEMIFKHPNLIEAISSSSLAGNRSAEICSSTLNRLLNLKPVSDRYLLGLAWMIKSLTEDNKYKQDNEFSKVNRLEVIGANRHYIKKDDFEGIELVKQDDEKTLKIFLQ